MQENVYIVRVRHDPEKTDSYVESHVSIAFSVENARADVRAKVARMGHDGARIIDVVPLMVPAMGPHPERPIAAKVPLGEWVRRSPTEFSRLPDTSNDEDDGDTFARESAIEQVLSDMFAAPTYRRQAFENALLRHGYKVVNARTGK